MGVLQTWTRDLAYHPHIHYLIPGGGLAPDGKTFRAVKGDFLMHHKAVAKIFKGKFSHGLKKLGCHNQVPRKAWQKNWVVDIEPVGSGQEALKYLTPYIFRVALSNKNILKVTQRDVTFRYRDRETKTPQTRTLPAERFIHRFLQHVLPKGFQKVRTFGLYHPKQRYKLEVVKELLQPNEAAKRAERQPEQSTPAIRSTRFTCPCCHVEMVRIGKINRKRGPPSWT